MENLNLGTPTNINGLLFGEEGKITAFSLCSTSLMEVICHGKSEHYVTFQGGFHAGKGSYSNLGIALGKNAIVTDGDGIQLGSGTNSDPNTLQVYDFKLLDDEGKIPQDRLPNLTIELAVIGNDLSWRYVGETTWIPILDITNLQGVDGQSFEVNEYGILNEAKIAEINNNVITGRYLFLVNPLGDIRVDNTTPAALNGDMSRHILMYDGDEQLWFDYGEFTGLQGEPGIPIELQNNGTYIQWKYTTSPTWNNIITLTDLKGDKGDIGDSGLDGKNIELDGTDVNYIRWRNVGDTTWINLINKSTITGPKGTSGDDGRDVEFRVYSNRWLQWRYVGEIAWNNSYDLNLLSIVDNNWTLVEGILSPTVPTTRIRTAVIATEDNDVVNKKYVDDSIPDGLNNVIALSHTQNTDTILDEGGTNEVSALEIKTFINTPVDSSKWEDVNSTTIQPKDGKRIDSGIIDNLPTPDLTPYALKSNVLALDNTTTFTPDSDYEPATKKYVDDKELRNFSTNPIDLESEITGILPISNIAEGFVKLDQSTKQTLPSSPIIADLTAGRIPYISADKSIKSSGFLNVDEVNKRLGVNKIEPPTESIDFVGNIRGGLNETDLTAQQMSISMRHFNKAYNNVSLLTSQCNQSQSFVFWGKGGEGRNAVTDQRFFTSSSGNNGGAGIEAGRIDNQQRWAFGIVPATERVTVGGNIKATGSVQIGDRQTTASADLKGTTRYREGDGYSVTEMCMKISETDEYAWKELVRNDNINKILKTDILRAENINIDIEGTPKLADSATMGTSPKSLATKEYVDRQKLTTNITTAENITPTGNALENELFVTALSQATTLNAPSGTAINGNTLLFRIYSASTQTLTWDAIYYGFVEPLPTITLAGKEMYLAFIYNGRTSKWDYVAKTLEV